METVVPRDRPPRARRTHHPRRNKARFEGRRGHQGVAEAEEDGADPIRAGSHGREGDQGTEVPRVLCANTAQLEERIRRGDSVRWQASEKRNADIVQCGAKSSRPADRGQEEVQVRPSISVQRGW
jgi:hypothetical protein